MDFATLIGLIAGAVIVALAMVSGSDASIFVNVPSLMIVMGGTFAATLIKFPVGDCFRAIGLAIKKAFWQEVDSPSELIKQANKFARIVRKDNMIALENERIDNAFFRKGIQLCVDGHKPEFIRSVMTKEMDLSIERHELSEKVFRAMGDSAPAFGMIGTLVGLVQMLANLTDASAIGPAMAIALLTTLYGALFAHLIANPIADKLKSRVAQEYVNKSLILESVLGIQNGINPQVLDELLESYLPSNKRRLITPAADSTTPPG